MRTIKTIMLTMSLFVCAVSSANLTFIEAGKIVLAYDDERGEIKVLNKDTGEVFAGYPTQTIQLLNWSIASAFSSGIGLKKERAPLYLIDTRRVICRPAQKPNLDEFLFAEPGRFPLKLLDAAGDTSKSLQDHIGRALQHGGGFLRIALKQGAVVDSEVCRWEHNNPTAPFDPNAWQQGEKRLGLFHGIQLFKDLLILDPQDYLGGLAKMLDQEIFAKGWQRDAILALEEEARARKVAIACSSDLRDADLNEKPWAREVFCFLVNPKLLPLQRAQMDILAYEMPVTRTPKKGLFKKKGYQKI